MLKLLRRLASEIKTEFWRGQSGLSGLGEEEVIERHLKGSPDTGGYCVDIAASDGLSMSNTYWLYCKGWAGLAVEYDAEMFARLARTYSRFSGVDLARCKVTPDNVVALLKAHNAPTAFDFLNLDIDGYDYFVLKQILCEYRPALICAEVNEKIPPPIRFTVNWDSEYFWNMDHFFGQSIAQLEQLAKDTDYVLVELHYNNAFLMPKKLARGPGLSAETAYKSGYADKPDRKEKFPWNANMEPLLEMQPEEGVEFLRELFRQYEGRYTIGI